ncbi:isoleucine--tRNA ligase [Novispirillum itersonii]|uniref:isoleucine--tRNA ligase n=1 Tax=Novispirillum itersonii TaxID=189 RepID=UPI000362A74D|nr:isoleucine--tRNA ligase [Novispirillum itersonii]
MTVDYKASVFLPKTDFPMRAGLPKQEPGHLERWEKMGLYARQRRESKGRDKFVLHDGPPYANGHLHIGHALNKILKDVISRSQQMQGKDSVYVPGWDCHGLPIEWKIEEEYRKKGKDKDAVPVAEFRRQCRDFADKWIDVQRSEFKRLGVLGDWGNPYVTMDYFAEAQTVRELGKFLMNGSLYRGAKPVMWSVVEKTALAEAEIEYHDHTSTTIWVRFPVLSSPVAALTGADVVIWTTTPWTMPGNRALAYGAALDYAVYRVTEVADGALVKTGDRLLLAPALAEEVMKVGKFTAEVDVAVSGADLAGTVCAHPLRGQGYDFDVPMLAGEFVTADQGTGIVHQAPGHGEDDFYLCREHGIAVPETVQDDGTYAAHIPLFAGQHVYKVAPAVIEALTGAGRLLAHGKLVHSYPHSWRSKAPLIYRTTSQWFISMEANDLRVKALQAIDDTRFVPAVGKNRLRSMIEQRPDWCVSRQRTWGTPITVFVNKVTGEPLRDQAVLDRITAAVEARGADAWFEDNPQSFLGDSYQAEDYEQVFDVLDVWFDSGSTHSFVLEHREDLHWPADLYLEGSDQHRGWFHSSLLEACGTRGRAPYNAVLTHGFTLDEQGRKMSKSLGNTIAPQDVVNEYGADILRLWVISTDYANDQRIGPEILKQTAETYRRLRNTLRYMLGALDGFTADEAVTDVAAMPELERWVLHRLAELDAVVKQCCHDFTFHTLFAELNAFCTSDLSAFYFDIRKDALYCDAPNDPVRRACRTVMNTLFNALVKWMAPFLVFTAEEAWLCRNPGEESSVHLTTFDVIPADWRNDALAVRWDAVRKVRRVVLGALEGARNAKVIGASLQAHPQVYAPADLLAQIDGVDMADVCITSGITLNAADVPEGAYALPDVAGVGAVVETASGEKCQRCWKVLPDVGTHHHEGVCGRCDDAVTVIAGGAA